MPAPPALQEYQVERRFWQEFGAPQPPLDDWPRRKVAEYVAIQRAIDEVEQERQRNANTSGLPAGGTSRPPAAAQATEETFQAMRAKAQPPPMPPGAAPPT